MPNPKLTDHGKEQCKALLSSFPYMDKINIILVSPLNRTLETVLHAFTPLMARDVKVYPYPDLKEWGSAPCNEFSGASTVLNSVSELKKEDALLMDYVNTTSEDEKRDRISRVLRVKKSLFELGGAVKTPLGMWNGIGVGKIGGGKGNFEILVVSHGSFLSSLLETR